MYTCGQVLPTLGIALPDPATLESGALTETPLSGCHCVRLLPLLPQSSLPSLTHLLAALLPSELAEVPRGTVSSAMRQCQAPTPLEKAVRGVEPLLRGLCLACQERDTAHGLVAGEECGSLYSPIICLIVKICLIVNNMSYCKNKNMDIYGRGIYIQEHLCEFFCNKGSTL